MKALKNLFLVFFLFIATSLNSAAVECGCSSGGPGGSVTYTYVGSSDCCTQYGDVTIEIYDIWGDHYITLTSDVAQLGVNRCAGSLDC